MVEKEEKVTFNHKKTEILQVWRVEKFKPVKIHDSFFGKFFSGDSYIVLKKDPKQEQYVAHFWLGSNTSQDESGAAAILTVHLVDEIGGKAPIRREIQLHESSLFIGYFPEGIQYLDGGVESGFTHFEPEKHKLRLLCCKGKKTIRIFEVPLSGSSLNEGDVFVLDAGVKFYMWVGTKSNPKEKMKAVHALNHIKSAERKGKGEILYPRESADEDASFWALLGEKPDKIKDASEGGLDEESDEVSKTSQLFEVSNQDGSMKETEITERPLTLSLLKSEESYVLVLDREVYVWLGKASNQDEKKSAFDFANSIISRLGKAKTTVVTRVLEGFEDSLFKLYFK